MKSCCLLNIDVNYLNDQYKELKSGNTDFDLALITSERFDSFTKVTDLPKKIRGFIITQKGECHKFPDSYCINLICSQHSKGSILIALFLHCIMNNPEITNKIGLLELANSYFNVGGLCLYSKYGFEYDHTLHGDECFRDYNNLPMIVDIGAKCGDQTNGSLLLKNIALSLHLFTFQTPFLTNYETRVLFIFTLLKI